MGKLSHSFLYKDCKTLLAEKYGEEKAKAIWRDAEQLLKALHDNYKDAGSDEKMMVLPLCSIYQSMKQHGAEDALAFLQMYGKQAGERLAVIIGKVTSIPGLSRFLWRNMPKLMRMTSDPRKGYERRIVSETKELVGVDILTCPLHEMAKQLGVPEITSAICLIDKGQMMGFRYIDYTRTKALGDGDAYCDYRLRYDENKK